VKKVEGFLGNALALILFLALGLGAVLFLRAQTYRPAAQQEPGTTTAPISPLDTPQATRVPTVIPVIITTVPTPTPAPSLSPTPTFEPLSDKPIGGYVFGKPEELRGMNNDVGLRIIGWVPNSNSELIVVGDKFIDTVDVQSGENRRFAEWDAETHFISGTPVWLRKANEVAFILGNLYTDQYELWISASGDKRAKEPFLTNVDYSFVPINVDAGVAVFDLNTQTLISISDEKIQREGISPLRPDFNKDKHPTYQILRHRLGDKVAYYSKDDLLVVNLKTKNVGQVNLTDEQGRPLWILDAQWCKNDNKLVLLLAQSPPPVDFVDLYTYDLSSRLQKVQTPNTQFIDAAAWAPDCRHILVSATIGDAEYRTPNGDSFIGNLNALFLVDTLTGISSPVPFHSPDVASSVGEILWSPDGKYIIARYRFYQGKIVTYRIDTKPL
jgi:WD40 repeat protein